MLRHRLSLVVTLALVATTGLAASASPLDATVPRLAYVDPGAGSFILQALVAMIAGAVVALNAYWKRIVKFFRPSEKAAPDEKAADRGDG
jgi:hypothetical protein